MKSSDISGKSGSALGFAQILAASLGFGTLGAFGKVAYAAGFSAGELLSLRFAFSSFFLGAALILFKKPRILIVSRSLLLRCALLGILGYAVFASFYFAALQGLSASLTALLLYNYPILVALGAHVFLREKLKRRELLALPVVLCGLILMITPTPWMGLGAAFGVNPPGSILCGLGAALFYAFYILGSRKLLKGENPFVCAFYIQLFAALALGPLHLHDSVRIVGLISAGWPSLLGISIISSALPISLFLAGLQRVSSTEASILSAAEPVSAVLVASFALREYPGTLQILGGFLILMAQIPA